MIPPLTASLFGPPFIVGGVVSRDWFPYRLIFGGCCPCGPPVVVFVAAPVIVVVVVVVPVVVIGCDCVSCIPGCVDDSIAICCSDAKYGLE